MGLNQAGKDEPTFKYALCATLLAIVVAVADNYVPADFFKDIVSICNDLAMLLISLLSIAGIMVLADKCEDPDMVNRGKKLFNLATASIVIEGVATAIFRFFASGAVVLEFAAIAIQLVVSVPVVKLLHKE